MMRSGVLCDSQKNSLSSDAPHLKVTDSYLPISADKQPFRSRPISAVL